MSTLSGGQKQQVALIRGLLKIELLILGESTGKIDATLTKRVMEMIKDVHSKDKTTIMVTNDMNLLAMQMKSLVIKP